MCLFANAEATLTFFGDVLEPVNRRRAVFMDLSRVQSISTSAIMCILSALESARAKGKRARITGNYPEDADCNQILIDAGFYGFVYTDGQLPKARSNDELYAIQSGEQVEPEKAEDVKTFVVDRLGLSPQASEARSVYETLIECMANTKNHAYEGGDYGKRKWWLMAHHDRREGIVFLTFLDNGQGIPATVRRNAEDLVRRLVSTVAGRIDPVLIDSAMKGESRTSTRLGHRGKGLRSIYENVQEGRFALLQVLSQYGVVDCLTGERRELGGPFKGTILCWSVRGPQGLA